MSTSRLEVPHGQRPACGLYCSLYCELSRSCYWIIRHFFCFLIKISSIKKYYLNILSKKNQPKEITEYCMCPYIYVPILCGEEQATLHKLSQAVSPSVAATSSEQSHYALDKRTSYIAGSLENITICLCKMTQIYGSRNMS